VTPQCYCSIAGYEGRTEKAWYLRNPNRSNYLLRRYVQDSTIIFKDFLRG